MCAKLNEGQGIPPNLSTTLHMYQPSKQSGSRDYFEHFGMEKVDWIADFVATFMVHTQICKAGVTF